VLHVWLRSAGVDADLVDCRVLNRLLDMAQNGIGRCVAVGGARQVVCVSGCLRLRTDVPERAPTPFRSVVRVPGETIVAGLRIVTEWRTGLVREKGRFPGALPARASLRRDAVLRRLVVVRSWQPGDRMAPLGMNGSKKLHDIFVDGKIPRSERHSVPIFECRGQIAWLPGYRVARGYDVAQPEDVALHIRVERT
jgi:tRNA(Ile)-lysidine synthase